MLAAWLAQRGFDGPGSILEGEFGFLATYCRDADASLLTRGLGDAPSEIRNICIKRFPCHVTAQALVHAIGEYRARQPIDPAAIRRAVVRASGTVGSHHAGRDPQDTMAAQYSVPFCVAAALHDDPLSPDVFLDRGLRDPGIRALCKQIEIELFPNDDRSRSALELHMADGSIVTLEADDFPGTSTRPLSESELLEKFLRCTPGYIAANELYDRLMHVESVTDIRTIPLSPAA